MKKCCVILLLLIFVFCFCACSNETAEQNLVQCEWAYCGEIEQGIDNYRIYYDTKTKVMYAKGYCSLTVLLNADGTPMLYEEKE